MSVTDVVSLRFQYLPANEAWMILWNDQRIAGPMPASGLRGWLRDHNIDTSEITVPLWMRREWAAVSA
jgi:hypothetical protein